MESRTFGFVRRYVRDLIHTRMRIIRSGFSSFPSPKNSPKIPRFSPTSREFYVNQWETMTKDVKNNNFISVRFRFGLKKTGIRFGMSIVRFSLKKLGSVRFGYCS